MTWRNRFTAPAPSMAAASCSSAGTACRPARKMIIPVPKLRHAAIMMSAGIDQFGSPSQFGPAMPNHPSTVLIRPPGSCSRKRQTTATATIEVMTGM